MIAIKIFTFNAFQENSYVLFDETKQCVIIDPGCSNKEEQNELDKFISDNSLQPVRLLNTHCHIDHILGNYYVSKKYNLDLEIHKADIPTLNLGTISSQMWNVPYTTSPDPSSFLDETDVVKFGNSELTIFFTPGHSPGSICFYSENDAFVIGGDVLFYGSIGRTDLPGGNHEQLLTSIRTKLFILPENTIVYSGHGPKTNIGFEKSNNPFLR